MLETQVLFQHTKVLSDFTVMSECLYHFILIFQKCKSNKQMYRPKAEEMAFFKWYRRKAKEHNKDMNKFETIQR